MTTLEIWSDELKKKQNEEAETNIWHNRVWDDIKDGYNHVGTYNALIKGNCS